MEVGVRGVRKRSQVLFEVKPLKYRSGPILRFWRTGKYGITRETIIAAGLDVNRYGAETRQLTFYRRIRRK